MFLSAFQVSRIVVLFAGPPLSLVCRCWVYEVLVEHLDLALLSGVLSDHSGSELLMIRES